MPYTSPPDKASGDIVTEANWDTHIKGNLDFLHAPPGCMVLAGTTWTLSSSTTITFTFGTAEEVYDVGGMHAAANPSRLTVQSAGRYLVTASLGTASVYDDAYMGVKVNGTVQMQAGGNEEMWVHGQLVWPGQVGDYFEMQLLHPGGVDSYIGVRFSADWIGATS